MNEIDTELLAVFKRHGIEVVQVEEVVTYSVKDVTGLFRMRGRPLSEAQALAERLASDPAAAPLAITRHIHRSFTQYEPVALVPYEGPKPVVVDDV